MKKLVTLFGAFVFLLLAAIVVLPFVVDVDQYRPEIVEYANNKINGKLSLGKLKLSLWGQIRINVAGVKISDRRGTELLSVEDAYFHIPFSSIFSGHPVATLKMIRPSVNLIKNTAGKLNILDIMKVNSSIVAVSPPPPQTPSTSGLTAQGEPQSPPQQNRVEETPPSQREVVKAEESTEEVEIPYKREFLVKRSTHNYLLSLE